MQYRQLATTDQPVSVIGLGTWQFAGQMGAMDQSIVTSLVRTAIDSGMTFVDTAEAYGVSEQLLGAALSDGCRDKCFLATKVSSDFTADGVRKALHNSLRALRTDHIDLYKIHRYADDLPLEETMGGLATEQISLLRGKIDTVLDEHDLPPLCPFPTQLV